MRSGRVVQVSVSAGGVPKRAVEQTFVSELGLERDGHNEPTVHGGPYRAVCLFGMEAIERVRAEGHPVSPGSVGENLTTEGIEWSLLPAGTRARVGDEVMLELVSPAAPCATQRPNFQGGRINRISILLHPEDSRMYARVLATGVVKPGDPIELLEPAVDTEAAIHLELKRIEESIQESSFRLWQSAQAAGHNVRILDDGELSVAASPELPGPAFNWACGLRTLPHFLPTVIDHFQRASVSGWLPMESIPWPAAEPDFEMAILSADVTEGDDDALARESDGEAIIDGDGAVTGRRLDPTEWKTWVEVMEAVATETDPHPVPTDPAPHLMAARDVHVVVAEEEGTPIGAGTLHVHKHVGLLRAGMVVPRARGRGIQRALIDARITLARELGCTLICSQAVPDTVSERNLRRSGLERLWVRPVYRFDPS